MRRIQETYIGYTTVMTPIVRFRRPSIMLALLLAASAWGCSSDDADTCTQGDTMSEPRAADLDAGADAPELVLSWDRGTGRASELPSRYFDAVTLAPAPETSATVLPLITSVEHSAEREITVTFAPLTEYLMSASQLDFTLVFPDRESFIDCNHRGMADRYLLDVALTFEAGSYSGAELSQRVVLGAI